MEPSAETKTLDVDALDAVARSVRLLTVDAVERSTTGHPGMAMGFADVGAVLFGEVLRHYNRDPDWLDRDRFVLSAGHGALLLYSLLHLSGYDLPLEEIMHFRRAGSKAPGHPERGLTPGIETTTGPLGAGFATAVGMAIAEQKLAERFNTPRHRIIDHRTYVISGDGCLMEGVSAEAASLAGHLRLGKLIVLYDSNDVSIEGPTSITFTEDVAARFRAYGWSTFEGSAHDQRRIFDLIGNAQQDLSRPSLIILKSKIGRGAATMEGQHKVHGSPLGAEEAAATRKRLGAPDGELFFVDPEARRYFAAKERLWASGYESWKSLYRAWATENPGLERELLRWLHAGEHYYGEVRLPAYECGERVSTREVSGKVLNAYADAVPNLIGGAADLSPTTKTDMPQYGDFEPEHISGRTIRFGVREHAMGSIANGITIHGGFRVFCSTILIFSDYMRPAIRLASLMQLPVIYVFTHDSIFMGGDGPTHQPIEQLSSLRLIPGFRLFRPGDPEEAVVAWQLAMERLNGPTALVMSRQPLEVYEKSDAAWRESVRRGAYVVRDSQGPPSLVVLASGSEVGMALRAVELLGGDEIRVVSVLSRELLLDQEEGQVERLIPAEVRTIAVEAGATRGWEALTRSRFDTFGINRFGVSGPGEEAAHYLGFTAEALAEFLRCRMRGDRA